MAPWCSHRIFSREVYSNSPDTVTSTVNFTTSYLVPTSDIIIATHTASPPDPANASAIPERTRHCPFKNEWDEDTWNPSPTDAASSCLPTVETITPDGWADPPGPTTSPVPDLCNKWHLVQTGDTCAGIAAEYGFSTAEFFELNSGIDPSCGNLRAQFAVCVRVWVEPPEQTTIATTTTTTTAGPPGPTESGTSPTCTAWHIHVEGDTCASIAEKYGIIVSRFRQLKRSVNSACTNLVLGSAYCVG
ncbi:hypothetical protein BJX63DRAFT_436584 [Aspergillus granulosus]|uniref:LysM domain-containing protein n=1 Tax=Aspergillus granulosus TaxID=176169 RepID=A0ABR4GXN7_9EURO